MLIAIDYDGTYTADPELWQQFIINAIDAGHDVICATMRYKHEIDSMCEILRGQVPIIYTERKAKSQALRMQGIVPDIWIDDNPGWLFEDSL